MTADAYACASGGRVLVGRFAPQTALAIAAATMAPGDFVEFAAPSLAQFTDHGNYPFDAPAASAPDGIGLMNSSWCSIADRDPTTGTIWFAGGRPLADVAPQTLCRYSATLNNWRSTGAWSGVGGGHIYRGGCVIPEHRRYFYIPSSNPNGQCPMWNLDTDALATPAAYPPVNIAGSSSAWSAPWCAVWFPSLGAQGSVIAANASADRVIRYDWDSQTWIGIGRFNANAAALIQIDWGNLHPTGHYNATHDEVILGSSDSGTPKPFIRIDNTGAVVATASIDADVNSQSTSTFVPHPSDGDLSVVTDTVTGRVYSYDWVADTWTDRGAIPAGIDDPNVIASSWPDEGVILYAKYGAAGTSKTYLFKPGF